MRSRRHLRAATGGGLCLFGRTGRGEAIHLAEGRDAHSREAVSPTASCSTGGAPPRPTWSESFISAGGSAFLLLVAILFPAYWYVSFFALTPLLYRIIKATPSECLRLGFLFGLLFFGISVVDSLVISPLASILKLLCGTALFALFGWLLGWARKRWGFNPFIMVFLWVGVELLLVRLGFVGGILGQAGFSHPFFGSLVTLFGFLTVSATIVLFNSLLVLAIVKTLGLTRAGWRASGKDQRALDFVSTGGLFAQRVYLVPESRAPPPPQDILA